MSIVLKILSNLEIRRDLASSSLLLCEKFNKMQFHTFYGYLHGVRNLPEVTSRLFQRWTKVFFLFPYKYYILEVIILLLNKCWYGLSFDIPLLG